MVTKIDFEKEVWEGWRVIDFIHELEPLLLIAIRDGSAPKTKKELKEWCKEHQPYYKKYIPDVVNYFARKYGF